MDMDILGACLDTNDFGTHLNAQKTAYISSMHYLRYLLSLFSFLCLLAACGSDSPDHSPIPVSSLQAQYSSAVADARMAEPSEVSRYLTPITTDNPNLIWENGVKGSRLLVVTGWGMRGNIINAAIREVAAATDPASKGANARPTNTIHG